MKFNKKIIRLVKQYFVDYIGFADLRMYQNDLTSIGGSIVQGFESGISIGIAIPHSIADSLPHRSDINVAVAYKLYGNDILNQRLNLIASCVTSYLNQHGFRTLPIAASQRADQQNALATVSHKMIGHIAGLGWIGKNCLLITRSHGPRVRFVSLLTTAPLKTIDNPLVQQCGDCRECVNACPTRAIKGKNYVLREDREARLDFMQCQNYHKKMENEQNYAVCGMCLYSCPYGKEK